MDWSCPYSCDEGDDSGFCFHCRLVLRELQREEEERAEREEAMWEAHDARMELLDDLLILESGTPESWSWEAYAADWGDYGDELVQVDRASSRGRHGR